MPGRPVELTDIVFQIKAYQFWYTQTTVMGSDIAWIGNKDFPFQVNCCKDLLHGSEGALVFQYEVLQLSSDAGP